MTRASALKKKRVEKAKVVQEANATYQKRIQKISLADKYVGQKAKGMFFLERCNMLAKQLDSARKAGEDHVAEKVDGVQKSLRYAEAEYFMTKRSAVSCMREAYFAQKDLEKLGVTAEELKSIEQEYFVEPILRESFDEDYRRERWAEFQQ